MNEIVCLQVAGQYITTQHSVLHRANMITVKEKIKYATAHFSKLIAAEHNKH